MRNRSYDKNCKLDCIKYCGDHPELSQADAARNPGVPEQTLNRWIVNTKRNPQALPVVRQCVLHGQ